VFYSLISAMDFEIAKPIVRNEFMTTYKDCIKLNQILFAPFGLHSANSKILGEEIAIKEYSTVFQQWQDLTTKLIFSAKGYDDDRIIATMHKFTGAQQDDEVIF
jgi:hypothetical protein